MFHPQCAGFLTIAGNELAARDTSEMWMTYVAGSGSVLKLQGTRMPSGMLGWSPCVLREVSYCWVQTTSQWSRCLSPGLEKRWKVASKAQIHETLVAWEIQFAAEEDTVFSKQELEGTC